MNPKAIRCNYCHASPGARCRTKSGAYSYQFHAARLIPRFQCPRCEAIEGDSINVAQGYCSRCRDWTGDTIITFGQDGLEGL